MATNAFVGSKTIDDYRLAVHHASLLMTGGAGNIRVPPGQAEGSACIVIESRRRPVFRIVALFALRFVVFRELLAMHIGMTFLAIGSGALEKHAIRADWNQMACRARDHTVSPEQWKSCFRVIETADIGPGLRVVTGLAASPTRIGAFLGHAFAEFASVRIHVATGAT